MSWRPEGPVALGGGKKGTWGFTWGIKTTEAGNRDGKGEGGEGHAEDSGERKNWLSKYFISGNIPQKKKGGEGKKKKTNNRKRTLLVRQTSHNSFRAPFKSTATIRCLKEKTGGFPNQASVKNIYIFLFLVEEGGGQGDVASSSQQFSALSLHSIIELHC